MSPAFEAFHTRCRQRCESRLPALIAGAGRDTDAGLQRLLEACRYSLLNGGKRIRPTLVYAGGRAVDPGIDEDLLDYPACAIEMVHVYSLVHDDLPAMDDDDLRRGKPSCHRAFDEATAILVGDGLQARAFELLATAPHLEPDRRVAMISLLAAASGCFGMVGGQAIDIAATDRAISVEALERMHRLKTGALIRAAIGLGGRAAGASEGQRRALDDFGLRIGLAFQIVDDILDVEESSATLGKTRGKDDEANKSTYVTLMGLDAARERARQLLQEAHDALAGFGDSADHLRDLAAFIVTRRH